jgi:hypothetical protein
MSLREQLHQNHKRFHAEIARRAALVHQRERLTYSIPNAPFGEKKINPMLPKKVVRRDHQPDWWHTMWFYQLVFVKGNAGAPITVASIQEAICRHFNISKIELLAERRMVSVVRPRQVAMYLCKILTSRSLIDIGHRFGRKDHTTVLHAVRKIEKLVLTDQKLAASVAAIKAELGA